MSFIKKILQSRFRLFFFFLLVALPVLVLFLLNLTTQNIVGIVNNGIKNTIQVVAFEQENWIYRTRQFLAVLSAVPEVQTENNGPCFKFLKQINEIYPRYSNMGVIELNGNIICSTPSFAGEINVSDRAYFQDTVTTKDFSVGDYQIERTTKKPGINFGYPILDNKGEVKYVLFAVLDLDWIKDLIGTINLPPNSIIRVIDSNGSILSSIPDTGMVGKKVSELDLLNKVLSEKTGTYETKGTDGIKRLYAFTSLNGAYVIIGTPFSYIYGQAFYVSLPYIIVFLITFLGVLAVFWRKRIKNSTPQ